MSATLRLISHTTPARSVPSGGVIWQWIKRAWAISTTRHHLAALDDRALADLGISRAQAAFEAARPFWDTHLPR